MFDKKPYACDASNCTKRYTDPSSLRKHARTHRRQAASQQTPSRVQASVSTTKTATNIETSSLTDSSKTLNENLQQTKRQLLAVSENVNSSEQQTVNSNNVSFRSTNFVCFSLLSSFSVSLQTNSTLDELC